MSGVYGGGSEVTTISLAGAIACKGIESVLIRSHALPRLK